jgi:hypothetical protein
MKFKIKKKPKVFNATKKYKIKNYGALHLNIGEQVSLKMGRSINEITKQNWGFYLTNSCNITLKKSGFKTAIVESNLDKKKKIFVKIVKKNKIIPFKKYLKANKSKVLMWLDKFYD